MSLWKKINNAILGFLLFPAKEYGLALKICVGNMAALPFLVTAVYYVEKSGREIPLDLVISVLLKIFFISFSCYLCLIFGKIFRSWILIIFSNCFLFLILILYVITWIHLYGMVCKISKMNTEQSVANRYSVEALCLPHTAYTRLFL